MFNEIIFLEKNIDGEICTYSMKYKHELQLDTVSRLLNGNCANHVICVMEIKLRGRD